jgi:probable F420-dependent oxidoreductase
LHDGCPGGKWTAVKFTINLPGLTRYPPIFQNWEAELGAAGFQRMARRADQLGFDAIQFPEHIVMPGDMAPLMNAYWPHALTAMAFAAGATERIRVNSSVVVLPLHDPLHVAKQIATLDVLSSGRAMLAVGSGHTAGEFTALGIPFAERGRRTDEALRVMKELWTSDAPAFEGEFFRFRDVFFEPKPVQKPHPPIWIGGNSRAALRRAARYGDGWCPWLIGADELPQHLETLRSFPEFGPADRPFDVWAPAATLQVDEQHRPTDDSGSGAVRVPKGKQALVDVIGRFRDAGVTWTSVPMRRVASVDEYLDALQWTAEEVCAPFRS